MTRWQRRVFGGLALLALGYAALVACGMSFRGDSFVTVNHWAVQFWAATAAGVFFLFAAFKVQRQTALGLALLVFTCSAIELVLQALGWLGWLPGPFSTKPRCPYGRVYYAWEGKGNSLRNRFGWYAPDFPLDAKRKIALVGDSFVEALEVHRSRTTGAVLQELLRKGGRDDAVLPLGVFGTSPAQHFATIEYAWKHFRPDEVVLFLFVGNDVSDSSPRLNKIPPGHFFYYHAEPSGALALSPEDASTRERFLATLEFSHQPAPVTLATTLSSHCMSLQSALTAKDIFRGLRRRAPAPAASGSNTIGAQVEALGLNPKVFELPTPPEVDEAVQRVALTLRGMKRFCDERQIVLRVVILPFFPPAFYDQPNGTNWTLRLGHYDFELPQRRLAEACRTNGLVYLNFTAYLRDTKVGVATIQSLYFVNGSGHFMEGGHRLCAQAVFDRFFAAGK